MPGSATQNAKNCNYSTKQIQAKILRTLMEERIENKLAIKLENPGAKQDCAMNPNFNSARQITSSPS